MIALARLCLRRPRLTMAAVVLLTALVGSGVLRLHLRTDGEALRPAHDAVVRLTREDVQRFHDPRELVLLVGEPGGPRLDTPEGLGHLRSIDEDLRRLPAVRANEIVNVASVPRLRGDAASIQLGTMLAEIPEDAAAFAQRMEELRAMPAVNGLLLSSSGDMAVFWLPLAESRPVPELVREVQRWVEDRDDPYRLRLTGPTMAETTLGTLVLADLTRLVPLTGLVIVALLSFTLGTVGGVVVALAEAGVVLAWTLGLMGWLGTPVTLVTTILPVLLMALSITDEIHLLERFGAHHQDEPDAKRAALIALRDVGRPIVATSVTTALGFLSFLTATIGPLRSFGAYTALGILLAMVFSFTWIPCLLVWLPRRWMRPWRRTAPAPGPAEAGAWPARHPRASATVAAVLVLMAIPGTTRLSVQDAWLHNFPPDDDLVTAARDLNASMWGTYRFDLVLQSSPEFFFGPEGIALVETVAKWGRARSDVGGVLSQLDVLGPLAAAWNLGPLASLDAVELADLVTVAQMSVAPSLRPLVTERAEAARVRLVVNSATYAKAQRLAQAVETELRPRIESSGVRLHASGDLPVATAMVDTIVTNQMRSIGGTLAAVLAVLWLFFARGRQALLALLPVTASGILLFGIMGSLAMPLGIATSMFAALTVGIGVDFGLHFLHRFQKERREGCGPQAALAATFAKTGRALRWNAIVLALGFLVLTTSSLRPNHDLGLLLAAAIGACYAMTVLLMPHLLTRWLPVVMVALLTSSASATVCPAESQPDAQALMARLEAQFRTGARVVRMQISTRYAPDHPLHEAASDPKGDKTLWGVFNGDPAQTRMLYTFSGPGRMAGTTLLLHDAAALDQPDSSWLYLRSFDRFRALDAQSYRTRVPGTSLTYEDSRGFVPTDKYTFGFAPDDTGAAQTGERTLWACPRDEALRAALGYDALILVVDASKDLVRRIEYFDLGGQPLKRYELLEEVQIGGHWFPTRVQLNEPRTSMHTTIVYEHWPLATAVPATTFRPEVGASPFLERLRQVLTDAGLGSRIEPELAAAQELVREYHRQPPPDPSPTP